MHRFALPAILIVLILLTSSTAAGVRTAAEPHSADCVFLPFVPGGGGAGAREAGAPSPLPDCLLPAQALLPTTTPTATAIATQTTTATVAPTATQTTTATVAPTATQTDAPTLTPTPTEPPVPVVAGTVRLLPEHAVIETTRQPLRYLVVLDVSGSMSANFAGQCDGSSVAGTPPNSLWQCAIGPAGAPQLQVVGTGPRYWWNKVEERRIYAAKRAVATLARELNLAGAAGSDATQPPDQFGLVWFDHAVARSGSASFSGFLGDIATAEQQLLAAGNLNGDPYRTEGGSNIAAGLYKAALALEEAPSSVVFNDRTYKYETRVLLITDSVANFFLDKNAPNLSAGQSNSDTFPHGHICRVIFATDIASCQTTERGGRTTGIGRVPAGMDRPITQAVLVSRENLLPYGYKVSVIALGHLPSDGLRDGVASTPADYYSAHELQTEPGGETNVERLVRQLASNPVATTCTRAVAAGWATTVEPERRPQNTPVVFPVVGEVALSNLTTGDRFAAPIRADELTGALRYSFDGLPAGEYRLTAYLFYRGLDNVTRVYSSIASGGTTGTSLPVTIAGGNQTLDILSLRLSGDVCARP